MKILSVIFSYLTFRNLRKGSVSEKLDCSSGNFFNALEQEVVVGNRRFSIAVGLTTGGISKWPNNMYLYLDFDKKQNIVNSDIHYDNNLAISKMNRKEGILVGNISEVNSLCLPADRQL